jgi:hypothetical protein
MRVFFFHLLERLPLRLGLRLVAKALVLGKDTNRIYYCLLS